MRKFGRIATLMVTVALLVVLLLPFTAAGSRFLLAQVNRLDSLTIGYDGGALLGDLQLSEVRVTTSVVNVLVSDVEVRIDRSCLWQSRVCLERGRAGLVSVEVQGSEEQGATAPDSPGAAMFEFPFPITARALDIAGVTVSWPGGSWANGSAMGSLVLAGSGIEVGETVVEDAQLRIDSDNTTRTTDAVTLPSVSLPLTLVVDQLAISRPAWTIAGQSHTHDALTLSGRWQRDHLIVTDSRISSPGWGDLALQGELHMRDGWPLLAQARVGLTEPPLWSHLHGGVVSVDLRGSITDLEVSGQLEGEQTLAATATVRTLDTDVPFSLEARADWAGALVLASLPGLESFPAELELTAPLHIGADGDLAAQRFELQAAASVPGYDKIDFNARGNHRTGLLVMEALDLGNAKDGQVSLAGQLRYAEAIDFDLKLHSPGIVLPAFNEMLAGRVQGSMAAVGSLSENAWDMALYDIDLKGNVNELPAFFRGDYGFSSSRLITEGSLDGEINGATVKLRTLASGADSGRLLVTLDDLSRWQVGSRGRVRLDATLSGNREDLAVAGSVENFAWEGFESSGLHFNLDASLTDQQPFKASLRATDLSMANAGLDSLELAINGDSVSQAGRLGLRGDVTGELRARGNLAGGVWQGELLPGQLSTPLGDWRLSEAVALAWGEQEDTLSVSPHCWQGPGTRVCATGQQLVGMAGKLGLALNGDMAFIAGFFPPGMEVTGTIDAAMESSWAPGEETELTLQAQTFDTRLTRHYSDEDSASVSWDSVRANVRRHEGKLLLQADMQREEGGAVEVELALPAQRTAPLSGQLEFANLRLKALRPLLPSLARLEGVVGGSIRLGGTLDQPQANGKLQLADGAAAVHANPTSMTDVFVDMILTGEQAEISGRGLLGGGELLIAGALQWSADPELNLTLTGERHQLLLPPDSEAELSHQLSLKASDGLLSLEGLVTVHDGLGEADQLPEGSVDVSSDVIEVDYAGNVLEAARPFDTQLNLRVKIRDRFRLRGREIDATVGGDLRLIQELGKPIQLFGNLNVVGGEVRAYGQRLQIKQGTVAFVGDPGNPQLNVRAERDITQEQVRVGVAVLGSAEEPVLEVYSDPAMSQTEVLSYLVRGRGLDAGAGADGTAVALSLGTGVINQSAVMSELNNIPGISNVEFGAEGTADDTAATVGGFIGDRIYLSYGVGLYEPINVLTARFYLQTRLWLEVVSRLENSIDLYYGFDID